MKSVAAILFVLFTSTAHADDRWLISFGSGPFLFGNFAESKSFITNGDQQETIFTSLSAETRAGGQAAVERMINNRFSLRAEASFTQSSLAAKSLRDSDPDEEAVALEIGNIAVTTYQLGAMYRFNEGGALRPYVGAGPAYAVYDISPRTSSGAVPLFTGARGRFGGFAAAGVEWWLSESWIIRAEASDIVTSSPFKRSDFERGAPRNLEIPRPNNYHGVAALVYRF